MNFSLSRCRDILDGILAEVGVFRYGIAEAQTVHESMRMQFREWLKMGNHGGMEWMYRYLEIRDNPRQLLNSAASLIVCAFPYSPPPKIDSKRLKFASYALGDDYHDVVRKHLSVACRNIMEQFGGETRICVDTAPLHERYWAVQAGLGFIGRNCQLIIPGAGSRFFLGTIVTTVKFHVDSPLEMKCNECGQCIKNCPGKALSSGTVPLLDARKCLSYLTIEHKGNLPDGIRLGQNIYGCDICQNVCPHNEVSIKPLPEFLPRPELMELTAEDILNMSETEYRRLFKKSAIKRAGLLGLKRNISYS